MMTATVPVVGEAVAFGTVITPVAPTVGGVVAGVDGAQGAPPTTIALAESAADVAHVVELEKYGMPPEVPLMVTANVPVVVTGEPDTVKHPGMLSATELTPPPPPPPPPPS